MLILYTHPSPRQLSMYSLYSSTISFGSIAIITPAKPPPCTRQAPFCFFAINSSVKANATVIPCSSLLLVVKQFCSHFQEEFPEAVIFSRKSLKRPSFNAATSASTLLFSSKKCNARSTARSPANFLTSGRCLITFSSETCARTFFTNICNFFHFFRYSRILSA